MLRIGRICHLSPRYSLHMNFKSGPLFTYTLVYIIRCIGWKLSSEKISFHVLLIFYVVNSHSLFRVLRLRVVGDF